MTQLRSNLCSCLWGAATIALLALLVLANGASAGEAFCDACKGGGGWDPMAKLEEIGNPNTGKEPEVMPGLNTAQKNRVGIWKQPLSGFNESQPSAQDEAAENDSSQSRNMESIALARMAEENQTAVRSERAMAMFAPLEEAERGTIYLDISENSTEHISGSVVIPYTRFLNQSQVRSVEELAAILGQAGISRDDPVIVYGECMPCGGGPAPATFVYWILRSMGDQKVRLLDGMVEDWSAAGLPASSEAAVLPAKSFEAEVNSNFTADYSYVQSGQAQIVDARTIEEYGNSSIPGAVNIPYESVVSGNRLKDESRLERVFGILDKDEPVVVYTNTGIKASVVWFALNLLGYDAKLYSYENYWINQKVLGQSSLNATA